MMSNKDGQIAVGEKVNTVFETAHIFNPLASADNGLWRTTLQRIQTQFGEVARNEDRLKCILKQSIVPEWPKLTDDPPPLAEIEVPIPAGHGLRREPRQLFDEQQEGDKVFPVPRIGDRPVYDATGKPILSPDGNPMAWQLGISRTYYICAAHSPERQVAACESFDSTATEAGRLLYSLPADVNRVLWHDWLDGFLVIDDKSTWINALFELAWQHIPGSSLVAKKLAWCGTTSIPLDALPHLRTHAERNGTIPELATIPDPPSHWYSVLDDLLSASIAAVDILLELGKAVESEDTPSPLDSKPERTNPTPRGRRKADYATQQQELRIFKDWNRARDQGVAQVDFAKDNGLTLKEHKKLIGRVRKRNDTRNK